MQNKKHHRNSHKESGVALFFALFALLLLSAIAASLVLMTNTETAIDSNFGRERVADYAAKAGFEEVRDRMMATNPNTINPLTSTGTPAAGNLLPTAVPTTSNQQLVYVVNNGSTTNTVQPWTLGNAYVDDELCHDGYSGLGLTVEPPDVPCVDLPSTSSWYQTQASTLPWSGTSGAIPYKWVRLGLKVNSTAGWLLNNQPGGYWVNPNSPTSGAYTTNAGVQVCWNGTSEVVLSGTGVTACSQMANPANPVYTLTSLAVTGRGTRKIVQTEVALDPAIPFPYGLYATGTTCTSMQFSGGGNSNPATDSFNSANGGTYSSTGQDTGGDVGSNGGVVLTGHSMIGGSIGVLSTTTSACGYNQGDLSTSGQAGTYNPSTFPGNVVTVLPQSYTFPAPPDPQPAPTNTSYSPAACSSSSGSGSGNGNGNGHGNGNGGGGGGSTGLCMVPGTYGAISLSGQSTLTLAPGTYNIYSLNISGQGSISVSPAGAVVLNFPSTSSSPLNFSGQAIVGGANIANNMQINYGGTGAISLSGQADSYMNVNAPNAAVNVSGQGDIYGRVIGKTLSWSGNGKFHYDKNSGLAPQSNAVFRLIAFRQLAY